LPNRQEDSQSENLPRELRSCLAALSIQLFSLQNRFYFPD
jgi:hypothetical protein